MIRQPSGPAPPASAHTISSGLPVVLATGAAIATDHHTQSQVVSKDPTFNNNNINVSDGLVGGLIAIPVVLFAKGQFGQDDHAREAGILGGEAMADGVVVEQVLKLVFWRERPTVDSSRGRFFQSSAGPEASFPSAHATVAWAAASAVAGEYHSPWMQASVYTGATAVSLTRVLGRQHFPSDALVAATGWLIGHYVVKKHHKIWMRQHASPCTGHLDAACFLVPCAPCPSHTGSGFLPEKNFR